MRSAVSVALVLVTVVLLVLAETTRSAGPPFEDIAKAFRAQLAVDKGLERENARLRRRNAKLLRKLGKRERQVAKLHRANRARVEYGPSGLCIHTFEGAWNSTSNPIYDGGLQMDLSFQRTYGGTFLRALGTADRWPPFLQVAVAMEAYYSGRGYHPWPNTARYCGLL